VEADLAIFKACSDLTRLRILFLLTGGELCVCELVAVLEMPQGKISRHLSVLKNAGLVRDRREGTWIYYSLEEADTPLMPYLTDYLSNVEYPPIESDRHRLEHLAAEGQICGRP
jgi:ArsR family transcriptional regulator